MTELRSTVAAGSNPARAPKFESRARERGWFRNDGAPLPASVRAPAQLKARRIALEARTEEWASPSRGSISIRSRRRGEALTQRGRPDGEFDRHRPHCKQSA